MLSKEDAMLRSFLLALFAVVALTTLVGAQNDPSMWPAYFNGNPDMGPYAWVDGPSASKTPQGEIVNGVFVGQVGDLKLYVCRAKQSDGTHPGKYYSGVCSIGWGGKEIILNSGFEVLVNTQPQNAAFLAQNWVPPTSDASTTFTGGSVGTPPLRVCRAFDNNGTHAGKV